MVVGGSANTITATASSLPFAYQVGGTAPAAQSFNVTSAQGSAGLGVSLSITPGQPRHGHLAERELREQHHNRHHPGDGQRQHQHGGPRGGQL